MPSRLVRTVAALASLSLVAACASGDPAASPPAAEGDARVETTTTGSDKPAREATEPELNGVELALRPVVPMLEPVAFAMRDGDETMWIGERAGLVRRLRANGVPFEPAALDLTDSVSLNGERGLLGLAFAKDGGELYVSYTDREGDNRVVAYPVSDDGRVDETGRRELLRIDHPFTRHHGGHLAVDDAGLLYVGLGDGEDKNAPKANAQSPDVLLGKILRIDPTAGDAAYSIPPGNPFADGGGRPEVFVLGVRNPWRFSIDEEGGALWVGDVGQYAREEINRVPMDSAAGANLGWPFLEGDARLRGNAPPGVVAPLHTYGHDGRCAVIGGYVYRGSEIPELRGAYVYGDLCDGRVRALVERDGAVVQERSFDAQVDGMVSFGETPDGELYVLSLPDGLLRLERAP